MKIDIFGSCVTRDPFSFVENEYVIENYFARSSLVSLYSRPLNIKKDGIELDSEFQKKQVYNDLHKIFRRHIQKESDNVLIIDFIDERLDVLKFYDTFITRSMEYVNSNLPRILNTTLFEKSEDFFSSWEASALSFTQELKKYHKGIIILHKAYWKEQYIDKNGDILNFENDQDIKKNNSYLKRMYTFIERNLAERVHCIELDSYKCDANHKWGLSNFHYEEQYYIDFISSLNSILKKHLDE
ncbi:DUF6270 domain-containing protein [Bacillus stercoris]|uniref:DUF6270 domain-containing protein n=1 Tax=Bacillus stercoris TaxID=2054641 RepID=UPI00404597D8